MASTTTSSTSTLSVLGSAVMVTVCLLLLTNCLCSAPLKTVGHRKVLVAVENSTPLARNTAEAVVDASELNTGGGNVEGGEMVVALESELRRVPSGPDPLHHHGSTPKKPDNRNNVPQNP